MKPKEAYELVGRNVLVPLTRQAKAQKAKALCRVTKCTYRYGALRLVVEPIGGTGELAVRPDIVEVPPE